MQLLRPVREMDTEKMQRRTDCGGRRRETDSTGGWGQGQHLNRALKSEDNIKICCYSAINKK